MSNVAATLVRVIDLCGREPPQVIDLADLAEVRGLESDDIDYILDTWAVDEKPAFIGEFEYQEVSP